MKARRRKGWLLALAVLSPVAYVNSQELPPALLPPSTFAARLAARRLDPVEPDRSVELEQQVMALQPSPTESDPPPAPPAVSRQADFDVAMQSSCTDEVALGSLLNDLPADDRSGFYFPGWLDDGKGRAAGPGSYDGLTASNPSDWTNPQTPSEDCGVPSLRYRDDFEFLTGDELFAAGADELGS